MLKKLDIQYFRGIKHLSLSNFQRMNFFLGKNNCGKSTLLEAIFLIIGISNPELSVNINKFRNLIFTDNDDFRYLFYQLDFNSKLKISAEFKPFQKRVLKLEPVYAPNLIDNGGELTRINDKIETNVSTSTDFPSSDFAIESMKSLFQVQTKPDTKFRAFQSEILISEKGFSAKRPKNYKEDYSGFYINSNTIYTDISPRIENIIIKKRKELLLEPLRLIEPNIKDISLVGTTGMIYIDCGYNNLVPLNILGDGFRRIFSILSKIIDSKSAIILLDEIENGLHYSSIKIFFESLIKITSNLSVQLFITTHSREALQILSNILKSKSFQHYQNEISGYTIRRHPEEKIIAYPYDFEKLEYSIDSDIEIR